MAEGVEALGQSPGCRGGTAAATTAVPATGKRSHHRRHGPTLRALCASAGSREVKRRHSGAHLGEEQSAGEDGIPGSAVPDFDIFPEYLRVGPWSPAAVLFIACFALWLLGSAAAALESLQAIAPGEGADQAGKRALQLGLAGYCGGVNVFVGRKMGWWPFLSYTMVAYVLLMLRLASSALGALQLAEALRFPVLAMAWVTTTVWWLVLVPLLSAFMPGGKGARQRFLRFNCSFFLVNVHLLNLPLAMYDHRSTWRPLVFWDLWASFVFALIYLLLYLFVLDANGMHFYIILSPRPWWCFLVYAAIIGIYIVIFLAFG
uniref:Uncharacterized protein n=1 Tax=Pyrodinium bahamense TaxID=73915 RepID=A0A7S0B6U5_9DINO